MRVWQPFYRVGRLWRYFDGPGFIGGRESGMLVLTRGESEGVLIGEDVEVTVQRLEPGRVVLGFEAPKSIRILRKELVEESGLRSDSTVVASRDVPLRLEVTVMVSLDDLAMFITADESQRSDLVRSMVARQGPTSVFPM